MEGLSAGPVLVLGTGQVGAFAARSLAARGVPVAAADLEPAAGYFARYGRPDCELLSLDVRDAEAVRRVIDGLEAAAVVVAFGLSGAAAETRPEQAEEVNVRGTANVGRACLDSGARLVFVSSFAVYGRPATPSLPEGTPPAPISAYGRMKAAAEAALLALAPRLDLCILRPCGLYGPLRFGQGSHSARLVEAALHRARLGREVVLRASAVSADEYLYVKDLGEAVAAATLVQAPGSERVFNVGPGSKTTAEELRRALVGTFPRAQVRIEAAPQERERAMPPLDVSRVRRCLGFSPRHDLASGLADYSRELGLLS